nr:uncharacterized protein LOC129386863 [Dermacentor andersoni]
MHVDFGSNFAGTDSLAKLRVLGDEESPVVRGSNKAGTDSRAKLRFPADETVLAFRASSPGQASVQQGGLLYESDRQGSRRGSWFKERGDGQPGQVQPPSRRVPEQRAHRKFSGGSGCSPEDLPTTDFGESLDLKQPGARATEQPLTQTGEVQLERQGRRNAFAGVRMVKSSEIKLRCVELRPVRVWSLFASIFFQRGQASECRQSIDKYFCQRGTWVSS